MSEGLKRGTPTDISGAPISADSKLVWETLRLEVVDRARQESALQALDRMIDQHDALRAALVEIAKPGSGIWRRRQIAKDALR